MILLPRFDPVAFSIGPFSARWYGLMYVFGFLSGWLLARWRASRPGSGWSASDVDDMVTYVVFGVVLGGRLGYVLFYDLSSYLTDPSQIFAIWRGGMSFHGGALGVILALFLFAWRQKRNPLAVGDFVVPLLPPGLFFGRIGNFINGELWGRTTDVPWGMVFPYPGAGMEPRHPSQLYEAGLEGVVLFCILWFASATRRPNGFVSGLFLFFYGLFRFGVEFLRQPDVQLGYVALGWMTMGQLLCLPMMLVGAWLVLRTRGRKA